MSEWQQWVGREEERRDRIDESALTRWLATLDREAPSDGAVPQGFHWCLALPDAPTASLGTDGHPRRTGDAQSFMPPIPLPRRMWASSKIEFLRPLRCGDAIARRSRIAAVTTKQGSSGSLVFVDVAHETRDGTGVAINEIQSIVFREAAAPDAPLSPPPPEDGRFDVGAWDAHRAIEPTAALLFRYSALTFNSHRIHYDRPYAIDEERYRGLVVHGPLTATLLLDLARRRFGNNALSRFAFRGVSPAVADEPLHLAIRGDGDAIELGAFAGDGRPVMRASAAR